MNRIYGYCRVSTQHQNITRQVNNIKGFKNDSIIYKEFYTGTTNERPQWEKLLKTINKGDTIVFDSVSRMSRNASEGFEDYKKLYLKGVNLIFLKERMIDTSVLDSSKKNLIELDINTGNNAINHFINGNIALINNLMLSLAEEQIKIMFEQSQKEVDDLHQRIKEGIEVARNNGTRIGLLKGTKITTKQSIKCKEIIMKHSKDFNGTLKDIDVIKLCECSNNSYYKYKKEIKNN